MTILTTSIYACSHLYFLVDREQSRAVEDKGWCGVSLYIRGETKSWFVHLTKYSRMRHPTSAFIHLQSCLCHSAQYNLNGKSMMDRPCIGVRSRWPMQKVIYAQISLSTITWYRKYRDQILLPLSYMKPYEYKINILNPVNSENYCQRSQAKTTRKRVCK